MAKAGRGADQYMLRLPGGLRDRIKAYSEARGTSINSEIIRILEREFPEPWSVEQRMDDLLRMLSVLNAAEADEVDRFTNEVEETLRGIIGGRVDGLTDEQRERVLRAYERYSEQQAHDAAATDPEMQPDERAVFDLIGTTWKFAPRAAKDGDNK
ncbi:Arc family DNA-binding protein [Rhizobium laguerreae]|uniref:Arc family DNA-binding protein n=1 Tax=Rhizobium laguerreae TaxID=1076926 RepID=UPI001C906609|nr:Arc family DNA-binding protein [Rhizobium laguerreae]MBY3472069.1 Arc family DNA-binding protein [Rhizobium laguerreae]